MPRTTGIYNVPDNDRVHLHNAEAITATRKEYLPGDHIRVKAKLAQALRQAPATNLEGNMMQIEAEDELKRLREKIGTEHLPEGSSYDDFVCILWR